MDALHSAFLIPMASLNERQSKFCREYVRLLNATQAAIEAGYSEKTARQMGSENLSKPDIRAEIDKLMAEQSMLSSEVLLRLTKHAQLDMTQYIEKYGIFMTVDIEALKRDGLGHLIKKLKPTKYGTEVEFHDVQTALLALGKHHKLFVERHEHTGKDGEPIAVEDARDQLARLLAAKAGRSGPEPDHQPDDAESGDAADL
jgi:phage terminase small subunit